MVRTVMGPTAIGYLLQHLSEVLSKQSDQVLQERLGLGVAQYKLLMVLEQHPHIKQNEIAHQLGQTEASISRQIKLMLEKGLLQTTLNPRSKRDRLTTPTKKGLRMVDEAVSILNNYHGPIYEVVSQKQRQQLQEILTQLHHSACRSGRKGTCNHPYNI